MSYLVLGSNSFSAGSFIDYLLDNDDADIFAVSRSDEYNKVLLKYKNNSNNSRVKFYNLDMNNDLDKIVELIEDNKIEYIVNFAAQGMVAQSWDAPEQWINTNTLALTRLVDKIYKFKFIKKFLQVSTPEVYGDCDNISESMNLAPSSPYAASKASADLMLYAYYKTHSFPVNFTRASNVYGAYQQLYRIIPKTVLSIKKGLKLPLHGGGKAVRNFIHINDVSRMTLEIIKKAPSGEIYHLTNDKLISIYDLVKMICDQLGVDIADCVDITEDRLGQDSLYLMNDDKISNKFGLKPNIKLKDGIKEVIEWIDINYATLKEFPDYYIHKE